MKITDIKTFSLPAGGKNQFIVKVETDEGLEGWGEGGLSTRDLAMKGAVQHYREWLIGRDPMRRGALWQEMYRSQYFEGGRALLAAQAAIDIALYDIAGKALGVPCYQLMGGRHRDYVDTFATTRSGSTEELIANVTQILEAGWSVVRIFHAGLGGPDVTEFEPRISIG
ncbi:MAG: mandelate racemase/muconate lactonizing enzyme family protein, partial [Anaerolineae bacterium]|nr:mandelate racemase/muconate lactonizing enzyme family protein [Anaerolineae bacterium]